MKRFLQYIGVAVLLAVSSHVNAQCPNTNTNWGDITPAGPGLYSGVTTAWAGDYYTVNVCAGATYTFTTCDDPFIYDTYLTLYNNAGGPALAWNDDYCGVNSQLTWTATFTGTVRILLDEFGCFHNTLNTYLVCYQNSACGTGAPGNACDPITEVGSDVGTFTWDVNGSGIPVGTNPVYLCDAGTGTNCFTSTSNDDWVLPPAADNNPLEVSEVFYAVFDCPPTTGDPGSDPCSALGGLYWTGEDLTLCDNDNTGIWSLLGFTFPSSVWFVPITADDSDNAGDPNGVVNHDQDGDGCYDYDVSQSFEVTILNPITLGVPDENCYNGNVTISIQGGLPEFDGSNYTVTNTGAGSLAPYTVTHGQSVTIQGLNNGDAYSINVTDGAGCSQTVAGVYTACACPTVDFTGLPASMNCTDAAVNLFADEGGFPIGAAITPCYYVQVFPTNSVATNQINIIEDGFNLGCFGPLPCTGGTIGTNLNFGGYTSYMSPSADNDIELCEGAPGTNMTYQVYDCHSGAMLASGTWVADGFCTTINVTPPSSLSGTATFSGTGIVLTTDWGAGVFDPSAAGPGTHTITYSWDDGNGCSGTANQNVTVNSPYTATSLSYANPLCAGAGGTASPTLVATGGGTYSAPPGLTINPITGVINVGASTPGTYTVTYFVGDPLPSACNASITFDVTIEPDVDPTWSDPSPLCATGASINLDALVTGTAGGSWSGTGVTGNMFDPSGGSQTVTYTVGNVPCDESLAILINVEPDVDPTWTNPSPICASAGSINLDALVTGTAGGSWSGTGVSGSSFNPASGSQTVTYTVGNSPCDESLALLITVEPDVDPSWSDPSPLCATGASINLDALVTGTAGGSWSGTGVTGNMFDPSGGSQTVTYTVGNVPCDESLAILINVEPDVDPTWTNPSPICASAGSINLDALVTGTAGGSWSGTGVSGSSFNPASGSQTVTYTVGNSPCDESLALLITVEPDVDPTWSDPSPICAEAGSINLDALVTGTAGGSWSGTGVTGNMFDPSGGSQTVTYTVGNAPCDESLAILINVEPDVDPSWTAPGPFCPSDPAVDLSTMITGTAGGAFSGPGVSGTNFDPSSAGVGVHIITYTVGNVPCDESQVLSITVDPLDDPSFDYSQATHCVSGTDPLPNFLGDLGGTFTGPGVTFTDGSPSSTGEIDLDATGIGTYTITYTTAGPCVNSTTFDITITNGPDATFSYAGPYCASDPNPLPTFPVGSSAGTFSAIPPGLVFVSTATGEVDLAASTPGTYTVTNDIAASGGCAATSATTTITIDPDDDPSFTYPAANYCESDTDPVPSITGDLGGTFTAPGVTFTDGSPSATGEIDLSATGAGTYTVTYTTAGPCVQTATFDITIDPDDDPSFNYGGPYCESDVDPLPTVTGDLGGTFTGVGVTFTDGSPSATGEVDLSATGSGTYTIMYTTAGLCPQFSTTSITIDPDQSAAFSYAASTFCLTGTDPLPTIIGTSGGTFTGAGITFTDGSPSGTGEIDLDVTGIGSFTVTYTTAGPCADVQTFNITITLAPDATFSFPGTPYCQGDVDPFPTFPPGASAGTFSAAPPGLVFVDPLTGEVDLSASTPGIYTITNDIAASGGCAAASATSSFEIIAMDDSTFSYSASSYCSSEPNPIPTITGLSGGTFSEGTGTVVFVDPLTGEINLTLTPVGGPYTIEYTTNGPCPTTGTFDVTVTAQNDATITAVGPYCETDPAVNLNAVDPGGLWGDTGGSGVITDPIAGTFDPSTGPGSYIIYYSISGVCGDSATTTIVVNATDDPSFSYGQSTYCTSDPNPVPTVTGLAGGTFSEGSGTVVFVDPLTGEIDMSSTPVGGPYTITYTTNGVCPTTATFDVTIDPQADATITPAGPFCSNDPSVNLTAVDGGGTWMGAGITDAVNGTFDPNTAGVGTHTISYVISGTCGDSTAITIDVSASADATITHPGNLCVSDSSVFLIAATSGGVWSGPGVDSLTGEFDPAAAGQGIWTITYTIAGACGDSDAITVDICAESSFEMPNVFSPNGDGINDLFNVIGTNLREVTGVIYNRWGEVLYEWNSILGGWDGRTSAGIECPDGTYYYMVTVVGADQTVYEESGHVTLLR